MMDYNIFPNIMTPFTRQQETGTAPRTKIITAEQMPPVWPAKAQWLKELIGKILPPDWETARLELKQITLWPGSTVSIRYSRQEQDKSTLELVVTKVGQSGWEKRFFPAKPQTAQTISPESCTEPRLNPSSEPDPDTDGYVQTSFGFRVGAKLLLIEPTGQTQILTQEILPPPRPENWPATSPYVFLSQGKQLPKGGKKSDLEILADTCEALREIR